MRWTRSLINTLREEPQEAEIASHKLMLRAGLIRRLGGGLYTFLPLGLRALRKVIPPLRLGAVNLDLSFMVLFFVVYLLMILL